MKKKNNQSDNEKIAILSMDIEDWYHLDYFNKFDCDKNYSLLDGINNYCEILDNHKILSNFFVIGEIAKSISSTLIDLAKQEHDIGSHGWSHIRPITMSLSEFFQELDKSKKILEDIIGNSVEGFRAPCFSLDRERLNKVKEVGFLYDSSRIDFSSHPLYEMINMDGYELVMKNIYQVDEFFEFQVSTTNIFGKNIPVSGGGYLRLLPWLLTKKLINTYLANNSIYVFYIHPFELSSKPNPKFPKATKFQHRLRFSMGRSTVESKLSNLINLLKDNGFNFTTFSMLRKKILNSNPIYNNVD